MNHIIEESRRLHNLVLKLLEISRSSSINQKFDRVDAGGILKDVCESMSFRAERYKKRIQAEIEENLYVYGQADRLRQLFINLLDNAIKYSSANSEIMVEAKAVEEKIHLIFKNPSPPFEDVQYSKLFQPHYSASNQTTEKGSMGLGLSIVKAIVEEHKGAIKMFYEENQTIVAMEINRLGEEEPS